MPLFSLGSSTKSVALRRDRHARIERIHRVLALLQPGKEAIDTVREIAILSGLESSGVRRVAWPRLLGVDARSAQETVKLLALPEQKKHREYEQVERDVERAAWRFHASGIVAEKSVSSYLQRLSRILHYVFSSDSSLYYYQGFHDVVCILLLVLREDELVAACSLKLAQSLLRDAAAATLEATLARLRAVLPLIKSQNPQLARRIEQSSITEPAFALSWELTWYSHVIPDSTTVERLFDFFLAAHPLASVYLHASVVCRAQDVLLSTRVDHSEMHRSLGRVVEHVEWQSCIELALQLAQRVPPSKIEVRILGSHPLDGEERAAPRWSRVVAATAQVALSPPWPGKRARTAALLHPIDHVSRYIGYALVLGAVAAAVLAVWVAMWDPRRTIRPT